MKLKQAYLAVVFAAAMPLCASAQSITSTKHNLSASGPGTIKAVSESEICVFCHTPHNSSPRTPLWNRQTPGANYILYNSSTIKANPGQPSGASILCLSCHDGTIALGNVLSRSSPITFGGGVTTIPPGKTNLTTDLSDDHPISFVYDSTLASQNGGLKDPSTLKGAVRLEESRMECTACHDPHKQIFPDFLVDTTRYSQLCLHCHQISGWNMSSHQSSSVSWNQSGTNPWPHTTYPTVAENGCENCHATHSAGSPARLMNFREEETNCLTCHNGNASSKNIELEVTKPYAHDVFASSGIHDPSEPDTVLNEHVECQDCHNPHVANGAGGAAPSAKGPIQGVRGVTASGTGIKSINFEYELCFRCHANSPSKPAGSIVRDIQQSNTRLEFDLSNPSFHPIEGPGRNNDVRSLIPPWSENKQVYCGDCHSSSGINAPAGPHGSIYPHILKYNYETSDNQPESVHAYELCYQCHSRDAIVGGYPDENSFRHFHSKHIVDYTTPCSACHDSHGISNSQGDAIHNTHLINFDISIVARDSLGNRQFTDLGNYRGSCNLTCHNELHEDEGYSGY